MAGFIPAIHVFWVTCKTWMPGTSPGMTEVMSCFQSLNELIAF